MIALVAIIGISVVIVDMVRGLTITGDQDGDDETVLWGMELAMQHQEQVFRRA